MNYSQAIILGIIQGITEFLPISSSAHLVLAPWLLGWQYQGLAYDVALHWGTLLAVAIYFWRDWLTLIKAAWRHGPSSEKHLFWSVVLATMPAALAGLALNDLAEHIFRSPLLMAAPLILFGLLMAWADKTSSAQKGAESLTLIPCFMIGLAQALAIVPGVSRSGITITAALFLGFKRETAARYSFLLSTPIVMAAGILKLKDLDGPLAWGPFWAGIMASAISGWAAISFLLAYLKNKNLTAFAIYRILLGAFIIGTALQKNP
ncbi:MAG: undecaprenyl-diphosphatase UppP [Elusimicrobia bacterium]|nr:undecaprenyl-diphosphatase UppP [Elusimicrobiota bacterium]